MSSVLHLNSSALHLNWFLSTLTASLIFENCGDIFHRRFFIRATRFLNLASVLRNILVSWALNVAYVPLITYMQQLNDTPYMYVLSLWSIFHHRFHFLLIIIHQIVSLKQTHLFAYFCQKFSFPVLLSLYLFFAKCSLLFLIKKLAM